jgi:hypothetical protein
MHAWRRDNRYWVVTEYEADLGRANENTHV